MSKRVLDPKEYGRFDVRGDGSCMLRAIYRAAVKAGILLEFALSFRLGVLTNLYDKISRLDDKITVTLNTSQQEDAFVAGMRQALANVASDMSESNPYAHYFKQSFESDSEEDFEEKLKGQPVWLQALARQFYEINHGKGVDIVALYKNVGMKLMNTSNWLGELDLSIIQEILNNSPINARMGGQPIRIRVVNTRGGSRERMNIDREHAHELVLINDKELHYNYAHGPVKQRY